MTVPGKVVAFRQNRSSIALFFQYLLSLSFVQVLHSKHSALEGGKIELSSVAAWKVFTSRNTVSGYSNISFFDQEQEQY